MPLLHEAHMKLESISLKRSDQLNEKWVQAQIADDPTILGLGDLVVKDKERMQTQRRSAGSTASRS